MVDSICNTVDYTYTDLTDEEVAECMKREREAKELEARQTRARLSKHMHFRGGMI